MVKKITRKAIGNYIGILIPILFIGNIYAQKNVRGVVTDFNSGGGIPGVTVIEQNTRNGAATDQNGRFSLKMRDQNSALVFSFIGYITDTVDIANQEYIEVSLKEDVGQLKEVVLNVGYGQLKRDLNPGAVSSISGEQINNLPTTTVAQALQGRIAGLNILGVSGAPGSQGIITVRGNTSTNPNDRSQPLYVIDGVIHDPETSGAAQAGINPLSLLNPQDIKSIEVLKDAASAAIYGARAANGVIIVTTKGATSSEPEISIRVQGGLSTRPALRPIMVGARERRYKMDYLNLNLLDEADRRNLSLMLTDSLNPAFNNRSDWQDLLIQRGLNKEVDLGISGRTETSDYRIHLNYYDEEGVLKNTGFSRYSANVLYNFRPFEKLNIGTNLSFSQIKRLQPTGDLFRYSGWNFPSSFWKITDKERQYHTGALEDVRNKDDFFSVNGNLNLRYSVLDNLIFTSNLAGRLSYSRRDSYTPGYVRWNGISQAEGDTFDTRYLSMENYLNYSTKFGGDNHDLSVVLGQSIESQYDAKQYSEGRDIPVDVIKNIQGLPDKNTTTTTYNAERSLASFFTRLNYDYKNKYILSATYRIDGSSRFGKDNRWAHFPSVAGGWIMTKEPFWPENDILSFFKIRASYGVTGREPGGYYQSKQALRSDIYYFNGRSTQSYNGEGYIVPDYANDVSSPLLSWEKSRQSNIGLEFRFLDNRIQLTTEYYHRYTADLLFRKPIPAITGYANAWDNAIDVLNEGWEVTLEASLLQKTAVKWQTIFTLAHNENQVAKTPGGRDISDGWFMLSQGKPLYTYRVWEIDGVYPTTADVPVDPVTGSRIRQAWAGGNQYEGGDPKRVDQNGDYIIDNNDLVANGNPDPKLYGGWNNTISYKNFSLQVFCNFIYKRNILNGYLSDKLNGASSLANLQWGEISGPASDLGNYSFWRQSGDQADYARIIPRNVDQWHIQSSQFIEDGSFFRIKFVTLGYSLPNTLAESLGLNSVKIWGTMDNVWTYNKSTLLDPEAVEPNGYSSANAYPVPHKFALGLQVSF